jgi:hypothetical protein
MALVFYRICRCQNTVFYELNTRGSHYRYFPHSCNNDVINGAYFRHLRLYINVSPAVSAVGTFLIQPVSNMRQKSVFRGDVRT